MITYKCNGGRLGENISFIYGIMRFCKINNISYNEIVVDYDYCNINLLKSGQPEYIFHDNEDMFYNIKNIFHRINNVSYFDNFKLIDICCKTDVAQLYNFYKFNNYKKSDNIMFYNWWSLDEYWMYRDKSFDYKLLNDICRPQHLVDKYLNMYKEVLTNSVGIHIRRGDFLALDDIDILNNDVKDKFNLYFKHKKLYSLNNLYKLIYDNSKYNNIIIFSDDIQWCKDNLNIKSNIYYMENNKPYEDLILMSLCSKLVPNPGSFFSKVANILNMYDKKNNCKNM